MTVGANLANGAVSFLVDSGASHNFISFAICRKLGLNVEKCAAVRVRLADQKLIEANKCVECLVNFGKV